MRLRCAPWLLLLGGCLSAGGGDRRETPQTKPAPTGGSNTGIVDGNGGELRQRAPLATPDFPELKEFMAQLARREPAWAHLFARALAPDGPDKVTFLSTDEPCFLQTAPGVEIRASYDCVTNVITVCKHLGDQAMAKADGWLLANAVAYTAGGSYEGSQRFLWVSSAFTYQWVWDNGFSLQTGVGLQGLVGERPAAPGSFGPVAPTAGIAFGVVR